MKSYLRILKIAVRYRSYAFLNLLFNILYAIFNLFSILSIIPFLQVIFKTVQIPEQQPALTWSIKSLLGLFNYRFGQYVATHGEASGLVIICIFIIIIFLLKNICRYMALFFIAPLRNGVVRDLRQSIYDKVILLPLAFFSEKKKGDIIARMTTDVNEIEWSIMSTIESTFRDPITMIFFFIAMILLSFQLTVFVIILLPLTALIIGAIGKSLKRKSKKSQDQLGLLLSIIEETLSGLRIIKGFNAERYQKGKFLRENRLYANLQTSVFNRRDLSSPLSEFLAIIVVSVILWFGGKMVLEGENGLTGEMFIGYILIFANLINPAKSLANTYYHIQRGIASLERVESILDAPIDIKENIDAVSLKNFNTEINYKDVGFSYDADVPVLKDINFRIKKGSMTAIVGPSGSGKSTLVDLLPRFHDATSGEILIDGHNIKDIRISSIRNLLGIVTQESILFNDTVFNNIAFGVDNPDPEAVYRAAKVANAYDFIMKLENGFESIIGDRGSKLSGGERQRLTIARAIFKNPPILILDEATSSLDTESEKLVQDALFKLMRNRTSIVIAHRLSTIQYADDIIVMQEGRIVERGNHNALIGKNGMYARLVEMQAF